MKNKVFKRIAAGAAALALVFGGTGTFAANTGAPSFDIPAAANVPNPVFTDGDYQYIVLTGSKASIINYLGKDKNVTIPETIGDGLQVTQIGNRAFWNCGITGVKIPDTVYMIEKCAFYGCKNLNYLKLSSRLQTIGQGAFGQCASLKSVKLPKGLLDICGEAFCGCTGLTEITLTRCVQDVAPTAFRDCVNLKAVNVESDNPRLSSVDGVMYNKDVSTLMLCPEGKGSFDIPETVTRIGDGAFIYNENLAEFTIPESITSVGDEAFKGSGLTGITIPENVTSVGKDAFQDCKNLKTADVKAKISQIAVGTFYNCRGLESISLPEGVELINEIAFKDCVSLKSITLPASVKSVAIEAFNGCRSLESVVIPEGVEKIGVSVFLECEKLRTVTLPSSIEEFGFCALGYHYDKTSKTGRSKYDNFTIICDKDSAAEKYAKDNGFRYGYVGTDINPAYSVSVTNTKIRLDWQPVEGAEKYAVARYIDGKWQMIAQGTKTSYTITNLEPATEYRVAVAAKFNGKWNMDVSNALTVSTEHIYPKLSWLKRDGRLQLKWTAVPDAEKYGIAICKDSNKWKLAAQTDSDVLAYNISSGTKISGPYWVAVCAKIDGKWDLGEIGERAQFITIG